MHDVRYAVRMLAKDGWFTVSCVIALALGIGATTAGFTLVNAALLRPLPVKDAATGMGPAAPSLKNFPTRSGTVKTIN